MLLSTMTHQLDLIESRINDITKELDALPSGSLNIVHANANGKTRVRYYHYHDGVQTCLAKTSPLLRDLARKKCLELDLKNLLAIRTAADMFVRHHSPTNSVMGFLSSNPELCDILKDSSNLIDPSLAEWVLQEIPPELKNVPFPESRLHRMKSGHIVRSKSEGLIDNGLFDAGIPFHYEDPLVICGQTIFPDFTIRHPETGIYYYWEHFGLMDDERYIESTAKKIGLYACAGILPGHNLITTFESSQIPLLNEDILAIIDHYFL